MTSQSPALTLSADDKIDILNAAEILTVDTEGMEYMLGFSAATDGLPFGIYLPYAHATGNLTLLQQQKAFDILHKKEALVFHNAIHDLAVLNRAGCDYKGKFYDTMLMAHWVNENRADYSLNAVSRAYGGEPKEMPEQMSALIDTDGWDSVPAEWMDLYSSNDSLITHKAFRKILPDFQSQGFEAIWEVEQEFLRKVMMPMKELGIKVDLNFAVKEWMRGKAAMEECIKELGWKPSSPKALEAFLMGEMGFPAVKHSKSCKKCFPTDRRQRALPVASHTARPSFDKDAMAEYDLMLERKADTRAKTILRYRGWQKTVSSNYEAYVRLADSNGILHPGYKLHGTRTGRLSCADPNLQQIPKSSKKEWNGNLKDAFVSRDPDYDLWTVDYSQLQFRMTVAYARQMDLVDVFNDPDRDIFTEMATDMGWERGNVKTLVYLILFGGGAKRASDAFGVSLAKGGELVEEFHARYPNIRRVAKEAEQAARRQGYVTYWTGRRRHFPRGSAYYRAFNSVIQGGEAEIIKRAMIALATEVCDDNCRLLLQIHDEVVFEIRRGMEDEYLTKAQAVMEAAGKQFCDSPKMTVDIRFATSRGKWGKK